MKELTFNIRNIFNNSDSSGCLSQYDSEFYHIPAYQRGYKWASTDNGAVAILLTDLWNSFQKASSTNRKEFYLQYITVKPISIEGKKCLEVIDGQQRLTTLSIILSTLSAILDCENIAANKLEYAIRTNFLKEHIYNKDSFLKLTSHTWDKLIEVDDSFNKQDIYYLHAAAVKCHDTFKTEKFKKELSNLYNYIRENVILIVNSVEPHISSETIFKNLNSNKVPLTESELIKGLFITKVGRQQTGDSKKHFQEITEIRTRIGRQWDEISTWASDKKINSFYFNDTNGIYQLLKLTAIYIEDEGFNISGKFGGKDQPLFNYYLEINDYTETYNKLVEVKNSLDNWFLEPEIYNLIGFNRFVKESNLNTLDYLAKLLRLPSKSKLKEKLIFDKASVLKDLVLTDLSFDDSKYSIHKVLLAINVFVKGMEYVKFDFYSYKKNEWTLEHIFPQTPEGKDKVLLDKDKIVIIDILGDTLSEEVENVLALEKREEHQKEIYYKALKIHPALNSLGNMCFLTRSGNASNGNMFFNEKRENIMKLIQRGDFVPKHTIDVFSKMFKGADISNMTVWTITDINSNLSYISDSLESSK
jgi:hypothetical protein